jgi:preprotein translocase subunit SecA
VAYKNEAFELFRDLMNTIWSDFTQMIFHVEVTPVGPDGQPLPPPSPSRQVSRAASSPTGGGRVSYSGGMAAQGSMALAAAAAEAGAEGNGYSEEPLAPVEQRRVTESEQLGRNDPCWCGSGKKFKKCHGA